MKHRVLAATLASVVALASGAFYAQAQTQTEDKGLFGFTSPLDTIQKRSGGEKKPEVARSEPRLEKKKKSKKRKSRSGPANRRGSFF